MMKYLKYSVFDRVLFAIASVVPAMIFALTFSVVAHAYPVVNGTSSKGGAGITSLTPSHPSGAQTGMAELALVTLTVQEAITAPSGWTQYDTINYNTTWVSNAYWHCYTAGDPNPSWTFLAANGAAEISVHNDVNCSNPIDQHEITSGGSSPLNLSTLTPTGANSDIAVLSAGSGGLSGYPAGWLNLLSVNAVAGMVEGVGYFATGGTTATGTIGLTFGAATVAAEMTILNVPSGGQQWSGIRAFTKVNTGGSTASIPVPTNVQANDALVAFCQGTQTPTFTATTGFNTVISNTTTYNFSNKFQSWCKDATGSESGTFGFTTNASQMMCFLYDVFNSKCTGLASASTVNNAATVNVTTPTVTTPVGTPNSESMVLSAITAGATMTPPPLDPVPGTYTGTNGLMSASLYQQAVQGMSTGQTFTFSSASNVAQTIALPDTATGTRGGGGQGVIVIGQ